MLTTLLTRFLSTGSLVAMLLLLMPSLSQGRPTPPPPPVYKPEIAYASNKGATYSIYVANSDGTNTVAVYSEKGVGGAAPVFVPGSGSGSGQLVFMELYSVKLLTFTVTPSGVSTNSVVTLATEPHLVHYVSVSPVTAAGQFVLYGVGNPDNTTTIKVISIAGGSPERSITSGTVICIRNASSYDLIRARSAASSGYLLAESRFNRPKSSNSPACSSRKTSLAGVANGSGFLGSTESWMPSCSGPR